MSLPERFNAASHFVDRNVSEGRGDRVAIECGDERVTYAEVLDRSSRFGSALRHELGVRIEERVLLLLVDTPAFAYAFWGAIRIGAVPVPVSTLWRPSDYEYVLNDSRARVLVVSAELVDDILHIPRAQLPCLEHVVVVGEPPSGTRSFERLVQAGATGIDVAATKRDDMALWLYSSGSTGRPKGCVHLHHDMVVCAEHYAVGVLGMTSADRCFSVAKLFFAYGLGNALYMPFSVGATSILWPSAPAPADVFATIEKHRPTLFFSVPTGYARLLAHHRRSGEFDLSSVRLAISAGEALPVALLERFRQRFGVEILDGIGSTETLHMFISNRPGLVRPGSSGQLIAGYDARVLDESRRPVPTGTLGDLYVKGDSICAAYWNRHEQTKDTIEGHWIRTGDKFSQDADGYFWYGGRSDDMLKVGGQWVSPVEVESALIHHPAVLDCAVVGREDRDQLVKPCAVVVVRDGVAQSPELAVELQEFVRARLSDYKCPRWVEFLPALPKTATGKIQRFKVRDLVAGLR